MLVVAIPAYNRPNCLRNALRSLEDQTYKRFMVIVVDDGSTEDIKSVCDQSTLNITYVRQENQGPAGARQHALDICIKNNIEYIMFMDSDDLYSPYAIRELHYEITHNKADVISSNLLFEKPNYPGIPKEVPENITWVGGKIYRVKSLVKYGINFTSNLRTNEDLEFNLKVWMSPMKIRYIDNITYYRRYDESSICNKGDEISERINGIDFIAAVYYSTKWAIKHNYSIERNVLNIFGCYQYYQYMLLDNKDTTKALKMIREIYSLPIVKKELAKPSSWIDFKVRPFRSWENNEIEFFPQSFKEWYDLVGVLDENI